MCENIYRTLTTVERNATYANESGQNEERKILYQFRKEREDLVTLLY